MMISNVDLILKWVLWSDLTIINSKGQIRMLSSLPILLQTTDSTTRTRAVKLFNSFFVTNTSDVFDHFEDFLPFYKSLLKNRKTTSVAYFDLTDRLIQSIIVNAKRINPQSVNPILTYFYKCFKASPERCQVDAFVAHLFKSDNILAAISALFQSQPILSNLNLYLLNLLKILAYSKSTTILEIIKPSTPQVIELVSNNSKTINFCIKCIQLQVHEIVSFISEVLHSVAEREKSIIAELLPYSCYIQTQSTILKDSSLQLLNNDLIKYLYSEKLEAPSPFNIKCTSTRIILDKNRFSGIKDISQATKILSPEAVGMKNEQRFAMSLSKQLDQPMKEFVKRPEKLIVSPSPSFEKSALITEQNNPLKKPPDSPRQVAKLEANAFKLGGINHGQWQSRYFEFYPINRCLIWKQKKQVSEIKGLVIMDPASKALQFEKVDKPLKGKSNVLRITLEKKVHEISFATSQTLDEWYTSLKTSIEMKQKK